MVLYENHIALKILLDADADTQISLVETTGIMLTHLAARTDDERMLELLWDYGMATTEETPIGNTPMYYAIANRYHGAFKTLWRIQRNSQLRYVERGMMVGHLAALHDNEVALLKWLKDRPMDIDSPTEDSSRTPLYLATREDHHNIIQVLLRNGAATNVPDFIGNLAIHFVKSPEALCLFEAANKDLAATDDQGNTLLHTKVKEGDTKTIQLFIELTDIEEIYQENEQGVSPLNLATGEIRKFLLSLRTRH